MNTVHCPSDQDVKLVGYCARRDTTEQLKDPTIEKKVHLAKSVHCRNDRKRASAANIERKRKRKKERKSP